MGADKITRADLREYLETERAKIEENLENWPHDRAREILILDAAIAGLQALDGGEVRPIFMKTKKKAWGIYPVRVRELQLKALAHIASLREMGDPAAAARTRVAKIYKAEVKQIEQWRRRLVKAGEIDGLTVVDRERDAAMVHQTATKWGRPPSLTELLREIERDGQAFVQARGNKKPTK